MRTKKLYGYAALLICSATLLFIHPTALMSLSVLVMGQAVGTAFIGPFPIPVLVPQGAQGSTGATGSTGPAGPSIWNALSLASSPFLTISGTPNSGANFDPATNSESGDSTGTGSAAAWQAAFTGCTSSPFTTTRPAVLVAYPTAFKMWMAGTTPVSTYVISGRQMILGSGRRISSIIPQTTSAQAAITTPNSGTAFTNPYTYPIIVTVNPNGATITAISINGKPNVTDPSGSGVATAGSYCLQGTLNTSGASQTAGTITITYSVATPILTANLSLFMYAADPSGSASGSGWESIEISTLSSSVSWAYGLDLSNNPNNTDGLPYGETTKDVRMNYIFTNLTNNGFSVASIIMDGCEAAEMLSPDIQAGLFWRVPKGQQAIYSGSIRTSHLGGQVTSIYNTAFQDNGNSGVGITLDAVSAHNDLMTFAMNINLGPAYFNGAVTIGGAVFTNIKNNNAATTTIFNVAMGGEFLAPAGTITGIGYLTGNMSTTIINLMGSNTFRKLTNNPMPLTDAVPLALNIYGGPNGLQILNAQTLSALLANAPAGYGGAVMLGSTLQKSETGAADANVLTVTPPAIAGSYRIRVSATVASATSGVIGFTISYKDATPNTVTNQAFNIQQFGTAAPALTFTTSAASRYSGDIDIDIDNSATNIVIKWVGGGTTVAKVSASIEILQ